MIKKLTIITAVVVSLCLILAACSGLPSTGTTTEGASGSDTGAEGSSTISASELAAQFSDEYYYFTDNDIDTAYDESGATKISFTDTAVNISGSGATADGTDVTISADGTYIISGSCKDGSITVATDKTSKPRLVLDSLTLTNSDGPALYVKQADKCFVTLAEGSVNALSDGEGNSATDGDTSLDAAVFSKDDLTINGSGTLTVNGVSKHGIVSKDDLILAGGTISVTSASCGLDGKDCLKICQTQLTVDAGTDCLRSSNDEDSTLGYVYIASGNFSLTSGNDGIQAETVARIDGGDFTISCGGGSENASTDSSGKDNMGWGFGFPGGNQSSSDSTAESAKGIKGLSGVSVVGGTFNINSADDSVHSNGDIKLTAGEFTISSGDDGMHADGTLDISGGSITVSKSYEGLEGSVINISGGRISIVASDDGINAAGGADSSSVSGRPGMGGFSQDSGTINISGGYVLIDARGDGVDSNGDLNLSGGTVLVSGPSDSANSAVDYETTGTVTGGTLVALGSSGMAENFTTSENQGSILCAIDTQSAGTSLALVDSEGNVVVSFTNEKSYNCAVITSPAITDGSTYTIVCGGSAENADENGFATSGTVSGGTTAATITMSGLLYSEGGMGGGMGGPGGMGGGMGGPGGMGRP